MVIITMWAIMGEIHIQAEMGYDLFQLCKQFDMKIKRWTCVHPNHLYYHSPIWLVRFQKPCLYS
jgi:hypothetical protein